MNKNFIIIAGINSMINKAVEKFLQDFYSPNNILIYTIKDDCNFNPNVQTNNIYDMLDFKKLNFQDFESYSTFPPLDLKILSALSEHETEALTMMDNVFPTMSYSQRKSVYFSALRFFNGLLLINKITHFICFAMPHQIYDYIIYILSKYYNLKIIIFYRSPIHGYIYSFSDLHEQLPNFRKLYNSNLISYKGLNHNNLFAYSGFLRVYEDYVLPQKLPALFYMKKKSLISKVLKYKKLFFNGFKNLSLKRFSLSLYYYFISIKVKIFIFIKAKSVNSSLNYFYFPLHYQPEGTTSPMADYFVNQTLIIEMISNYLPKDYYLVIKEHPNQTPFTVKNLNFFKRLSALKNIIIIPTSTKSLSLIRDSKAVISATGTVLLESLFLKKPAMMFGNYVMQYAPNIFHIKNNSDCIRAIEIIIKGDFFISDFESLVFLKTLETFVIPGEFALRWTNELRKLGISLETSNENIYRKLVSEI
jgi:hypothetical protein